MWGPDGCGLGRGPRCSEQLCEKPAENQGWCPMHPNPTPLALAALPLARSVQEALYEEHMGAKASAAAAVAQLCREPGGLEALMEQPALLQVWCCVTRRMHRAKIDVSAAGPLGCCMHVAARLVWCVSVRPLHCRRWRGCCGRMPGRPTLGSCASACWPHSWRCRICQRRTRCCSRWACAAGACTARTALVLQHF